MTRPLLIIAAFLLGMLGPAGTAAAQPVPGVHRIAYLSAGSEKAFRPRVTALRQGLKALGYVEGRNLVFDERYAAGKPERLPALASELVRLEPEVIVIHGTSATRAVKRVSGPIPIVFCVVADPVGSGFVASLDHPGGTITGLSDDHSALVPKRMELLKEVMPSARRIAVFWHRGARHTVRQLETLRNLVPRMGVTLSPVEFASPADLDRAAAAFRDARPDALNVLGYALMAAHRKRIADFSIRHLLAAISTTETSVEAGFLLSYGVNFPDINRRAATYVDKILKGASPADLPVELPTRFYLAVNLKTAKKLGITIPRAILLRADRVIE